MKKWLLFFTILFLVVSLAIAVSITFYWLFNKPVSVSRDSVLEISIGGSIIETPSDNPLLQLLEPDKPSLSDYWQMLTHAGSDERIRAVFLEIQPLAMSWAQVEELRDALRKFRSFGKPVHAFLAVDLVQEPELYLAAAADSMTVNPDTSFLVNGLVAEVTFYKRTLDKLGVKPQFIQFKEFKSPQVYEREELSAPLREMLASIIGDLERRFVSGVTRDRDVEEKAVREFMTLGLSTPQSAMNKGLIDRIGYREDVWEALRQTTSSKLEKVSASDYLDGTRSAFQPRSPHRVALVTGVGTITAGKSEAFTETLGGSTLASHLRKIREDKRFEAVLLRVNSPGGSAVGSDMVWKEVRLLEEAGKPVVVSMSGVAGSGGYYIAMGASRIVSQPSTITGSIGVIFGKFDIEGLYNWLGMTVDRVKISPNADLFSPFTTLTGEQKEQVETWVEEVYEGFVRKAAEGRQTSFQELETKARGRIYTGSQALELGLVDALGGFDTAIEHLKEVLDLEAEDEIQLVQYPRPKTFWEALSSSGLIESRAFSASFERWLREETQTLSTPAPRLLMPEIHIR